jgi:hypothetical protein
MFLLPVLSGAPSFNRSNSPKAQMAIELAFPELTPREFLDHIVRPNMAALRADPGSLRHAHNAVLTADALAAHVFLQLMQIRPAVIPEYKTHDDGYRDALSDAHPAYRTLRDLAAALKHAALLRPKPRIVRAAGQMGARRSGWDNAIWDVDVWDGDFLVVVHTDDDEVARPAFEIIEKGVEVLEAEMLKHGL